MEIVIADPGVGFKESLRNRDAQLDDLSAIKLGLQGITGRVGEKRGNGLKLVQEWTIGTYHGCVRIHSGAGLVIVDDSGTHGKDVNKILGTLASFVVTYN